MKYRTTLLAIAFFMTFAGMVYSQDFRGDWSGGIELDGRDSVVMIRIVIEGGSARQYFPTDDGGWSLVEPRQAQYTQHQNNAHISWIASGGIWTETQSFHLSMINENELEVVYVRHVNNRTPGEDGEPWFLRGRGILARK